MHNTRSSRHGRPHSPHLVHPPFPSFAWVMTAKMNPPTRAYTYGYVQNARAHARAQPQMQTQPQTRLPASCSAHREPNPHFAKSLLPPAPAGAKASSAALHDTFMETVDHRDHDLPTRPYVPWRAALASCEMQQLPPLVVSPSRTKRRRLDSLLRALRRACGLSKDIRPGRAAA